MRRGVWHALHAMMASVSALWRMRGVPAAYRGVSEQRTRRTDRRRRRSARIVEARRLVHIAGSDGRRDHTERRRLRAARWSNSVACAPCSACRLRKDDALLGMIRDLPPGGAAVLRQADRAAGELRRPGGDRDGERAAAHRAAGGAGAADRDRRGVAGDQRLARQSRAGVRCDAGKGASRCAAPRSARLLHL